MRNPDSKYVKTLRRARSDLGECAYLAGDLRKVKRGAKRELRRARRRAEATAIADSE